jgi:Ala-tRNA(Pro) deacylase
MPIAERLHDYLDDAHVDYLHTTHHRAYTARSVALAEHLAARELAKTVIFEGDGVYGAAVLAADCLVDLKRLQEELGLSSVRLASEDEIERLFPDSEAGAMAPFASLYGLPVIVDTALARQEIITFNAGTHKDAIHMRFAEFDRLASPKIVSFARPV